MKKILSLIAISVICSGFFAMPVFAVEFQSSQNLAIDTPTNDDLYIAGGRVEVSADVTGDLFVAGGEVTITGNVSGDLVVAGGKVSIRGNVGDDLRILGGQIAVYGNVGDDVIVGGGQLDISKTTVIGGSLVSGAGYLTIDGEVKGDVKGGVGMLVVNGKIGGNLIVTVEDKLSVSEKALIKGDVKYSALIDMNVPKDAVKGMIRFNKFEKENTLEEVTKAYLGYELLSFLSGLLILLLLVLMAPNTVTRAAMMARKDVLKTFGVGVVAMIAAFVGSILLMITLIAIPLGIILFIGLLIASYMAKFFVAIFAVSFVMDMKKTGGKYYRLKLFLLLAVALLAYFLIGMIPYVGWLIDIVLFLIGIGTIVLIKNESWAFLRAKKMM